MNATQNSLRDEPLRKLNPSPRQAYRITLTISDAPGPLVLTDARAQYDVTNENVCGKERPSGGVYRITSNEPLSLAKTGENTYEGIVYADRIIDEDYYGDGVCHWELTEVRATLSASGNPAETQFAPSIAAEAIRAQVPQLLYFANLGYPHRSMDGFVDFGAATQERFKPEIRGELFNIALNAMEVQP